MKRTYRVRRVTEPNDGPFLRLDMLVDDIVECTLHGINVLIDELPPTRSGDERTQLKVGFHCSRDAWYYFYKILVLLYALTTLHMQVYLMDPRDVEARVSTTATYYLAGFALLYVAGETLPVRQNHFFLG